MIVCNLKYGILTSYEQTIFLQIEQDHRGEASRRLISESVYSGGKSPYLLQAYLDFFTLLDDDFELGILNQAITIRNTEADGQDSYERGSTSREPEGAERSQSFRAYNLRLRNPRGGQQGPRGSTLSTYQAMRFSLKECLFPSSATSIARELTLQDYLRMRETKIGEGEGGIIYCCKVGQERVGEKVCDRWKEKESLQMMLREKEIYERLQELQGKVIPKLLGFQNLANMALLAMQ